MPLTALRRLAGKVLGGQALADDYELHCGVVASTTARTPMAEVLNKELDRRYALQLSQVARCKDVDALARWWQEASSGKDLAGALWATLSSGRCTSELEHRVLGEVHMLQHQVGMAARVDLAQMDALLDENAVLTRELAAAQRRSTDATQQQAVRMRQLEAELVRLRGELIRCETARARVADRLAEFEAAAPDLRTRFELTRANREQAERLELAQRQLLQAQQLADGRQRQLDEASGQIEHLRRLLEVGTPCASDTIESGELAALLNRAVLCVGGRTSVVPIYRQLIERTGGRFLHHDGGEQDGAARLDSTLAAADLVICQTGCISHDAYWRVKNHCKRTGKRCVFVDTPSKAALERALGELCHEAKDDEDAVSAAASSPLQSSLPG
jgi:ketosteroid isomerase-like protein